MRAIWFGTKKNNLTKKNGWDNKYSSCLCFEHMANPHILSSELAWICDSLKIHVYIFEI